MKKHLLAAVGCALACIAGCGGSSHHNRTFVLALTVTPSGALADGTVGTAYSQQFTATGGNGAITWAIAHGALPAGLSLDTNSGLLSGTPTTITTSAFTVGALDSTTGTARVGDAACTLTIDAAALVITSPSAGALPGAQVGTAYSETFVATGGTGAHTWAVTTGTLPAGLTLDANSGALTGTPTTPTASPDSFSVTVTDAASVTDTAAYTLAVAPPTLAITAPAATALPAADVGAPYSATFTATGGTGAYTWSITTGSLPTGLTLTAGTGVISGVATVTASASFTIEVTDASNVTATAAHTLNAVLAGGTLYVANFGAQYSTTEDAGLAIWRFDGASTVSGTGITPDGTIAGTNAKLVSATATFPAAIAQMAVDPIHDVVWFTVGPNGAHQSLPAGVYAFENAHTANGNIAHSPSFAYAGTNTAFVNPVGVAVDGVRDIVYVADSGTNKLSVFSLSQTGNVTATATLSGFSGIRRIFLDQPHDTIYVANVDTVGGTGSVVIYTTASTSLTFSKEIISTAFDSNVTSVFYDAVQDVLYVGDQGNAFALTNNTTASIFAFDAASSLVSLVNTTPDRALTSTSIPDFAVTQAGSGPSSVLFDFTMDAARDTLYIADPGNASLAALGTPSQVIIFENASAANDPQASDRNIFSTSFTADVNDPADTIVLDPAH